MSPVQVALRDALRIWAWQHLNKFPATWFSEYELARVIREQYACDPMTLCPRYGRVQSLHRALVYLEGRGEAVTRMSMPDQGRGGRFREWQAARAEQDPMCPLCEQRHPEGTACALGRGRG